MSAIPKREDRGQLDVFLGDQKREWTLRMGEDLLRSVPDPEAHGRVRYA